MFEFTLANLLFQVSAGVALVLLASSAAARDMLRRRTARTYTLESQEAGTVVELPKAIRAPNLVSHDVEAQSQAA